MLFTSPLEPKFNAKMKFDYDKRYHSIIMNVGYTNCKLEFRIDIEKDEINEGLNSLRNMCELLRELRDGKRTQIDFTGDHMFFLSPPFEIQCTYGEYILRNNRNLVNRGEESFEIRSTTIVDKMIKEFEIILDYSNK
jgi:hypothetical protein